MAGGGHFAGAIFKGNEVLKHKTFHRYTVRARRGTAQGVREVQGSMPKSAGASLRRYNEFALLKVRRELLASWAGDLQEAECIFVRAPGSNRARFFGSKNGPLQRDDPRVRGIPFSTRRATFREVQRVHATLSNLQVYGEHTFQTVLVGCGFSPIAIYCWSEEEEEGEEESLKQLELVEATLSTLELREFEVAPKRNRKKKRKKAKAEAGRHNSFLECLFFNYLPVLPDIPVQDALFTACKIGDMTTLQHLLGVADSTADEGVECNALASHELLNMPLDESGWTLLHVAAAAGRSAVVRLLLETGADPALRDRQEQPPYCVSATKQTRNEFRRFMAEHPVKYDYVQAQVPGPLTAEMETRQTERRRAHKAQRKQREKEEREVQQLLEKEEEEKRRFALLSDREKVRAQSSHVIQTGKGGNLKRCWLCGESLLGRIPFHYLDFSFCSTSCLRAHRERKATPS
uniref:Ankyrin repeat and zinc finger peptidyl tRNA hydrolase 1 n=1 Tax=Varanus komodoensis TaxID=61221 RepID=A0A8D2IL56_VARKO